MQENHRKTNQSSVFDVRAHGATGDGKSNDTAAAQHAIDTCHAAGGGRVYFGGGTYQCGTLNLKSNVELYLDASAILRGSPHREDYSMDGNAPYDTEFSGRRTSVAHLINAYKADNIAIRGRGIIDGNGTAFFGPPKEDHPLRRFVIPGWRPGHMLAFCECQDVLIENVQLLNTPTYTVWPFACERLRIIGVTIRNPPETPNGDGIDPTACRDVLINNCFIDTADDCIALYSGPANGSFGAEARACENVVITNCVLHSCCAAVRLGPHGDGAIRNCVMGNLVIDARIGIGMYIYARSGGGLTDTIAEHINGPLVENIQARNIDMNAWKAPICMQVHPDSHSPSGIRDIIFSGLNIRSPGAICATGAVERPIERLEFSDIAMRVGMPEAEMYDQVPDPLGKLASAECLQIPHIVYLRRVHDAYLRGLRIYKQLPDDKRTLIGLEQSLRVHEESNP